MKIVSIGIVVTLVILLGSVRAFEPGKTALQAGDPAPDFHLQGSDGKTYTLKHFTGKKAVVIAWFPKAFTGG